MAAHPRSRGENVGQLVPVLSGQGSSPLTRGKRVLLPDQLRERGLIPAHAGKTSSPPPRRSKRRAHPRSRGENTRKPRKTRRDRGSSPLTRGKHTRRRTAPLACGLIPAHAGKTFFVESTPQTGRAHPRSRGENPAHAGRRHHWWGSSPLTRGKRLLGRRLRVVQRLIPAHAGKTQRRACQPPEPGAHPRSRGENMKKADAEALKQGSSPLTRGKLKAGAELLWNGRLIPAHAGKTLPRYSLQRRRRAHPRSRGENGKLDDTKHTLTGSSPLTRGKRAQTGGVAQRDGLIPAHAGKTRRGGAAGCRPRAHPRSRGENSILSPALERSAGSSPLTRGKPRGRSHRPPSRRLIPAHAGKTRPIRASRPWSRAHPRSRGENTS